MEKKYLLCKIEDGIYEYQYLQKDFVNKIILPFGWFIISS